MPRPRLVSPDILEAALAGLEARKQKIEDQIAPKFTECYLLAGSAAY